jgi:hypothetical protein
MFGTEIAGTGASEHSIESAAGREGRLPAQLIRCLSVDRPTIARMIKGSSLDRGRGPGVPMMLPSSLLPADTVSVSMGPLPRADILGEFTDLFRDACRRKDPEVMAESALWFYSNPRNFDPAAVGGLVPVRPSPEKVSRCSVVITGGPPELRGRQVDGTFEVLGPGDDAYEFLAQAWKMFVGRGDVNEAPGSACLFRVD